MTTPSTVPFARTNDNAIDAITTGYVWGLDSSRTIRWSLSQGLSGEVWNYPTQTASTIAQAFQTFSYYANIKFEYLGYYSSPYVAGAYSDINIAGDAGGKVFSNNTAVWAIGLFPNASYNTIYYGGAPGDIYLNLNSAANYLSSYAPGSAGFSLALHEIGHTLGLKHTHDDGSTGRPTLTSLGVDWLDKDWFSIMSYRDDFNFNLRSWDPATPMLLDVIGLQYLYGKNTQTNAGDSTFTLPLNNSYQTIWDASGHDVINVSSSIVGWDIYLPDIQISSLVSTKAGAAVPSYGVIGGQNTFYWLTGDIEDASGSAYADTIIGSALNNQIAGNGGNDKLSGLGGDDTFYRLSGKDAIYGGSGLDTLNVGLQASQCTFARLRDNSFVISDTAGNMALCRDIERLVFSNAEYNPASLTNYGNIDSSLVQIYVAAFRRTPELSGYKYWLQQEIIHGLKAVADTIFSLDIVKAIYPTSLTNAQFVTAIYQNVFSKAPDTDGLLYWSAQLAMRSRGQLVIDMTNVAMAVPDGTSGKEFFQNRVDWSLYAVNYQNATNKEISVSRLSALSDSVTDDTVGLISLIGQSQAGIVF
jgi:hypothetical protein